MTRTAGAGVELGVGRRKHRQFEEGRVPVEEQLEAFANEQLASLAMTGDVLLAPAGQRFLLQLLDLGDLLEHGGPIRLVILGVGVGRAAQEGHGSAG